MSNPSSFITKQMTTSFPCVRIKAMPGVSPIEVHLLSQLSPGSGDKMIRKASAYQCHHPEFVDECDEPSAKLGPSHFESQDPSSLHSFIVGARGHSFHRHASSRMFTAIAGSAGAELSFSTASAEQLEHDPALFLKYLHCIHIPADALFTVRFGRNVWHRFCPLPSHFAHPALFALSCHPNDLEGEMSNAQRAKVLAGEASISTLTEELPLAVQSIITHAVKEWHLLPSVKLSLGQASDHYAQRFCARLRAGIGWIKSKGGRSSLPGFACSLTHRLKASAQMGIPTDSLLKDELLGVSSSQLEAASSVPKKRGFVEDTFTITIPAHHIPSNIHTKAFLAAVLEGFLKHRPKGVSALMKCRNTIVKPLGLRVSPLGCPVSSLLSPQVDNLFENRYPVLNQWVTEDDSQVILGADDMHLQFRSLVRVKRLEDGSLVVELGSRVLCRNLFGQLYMGLIKRVHHHVIGPALLELATDFALKSIKKHQ